MKKLISKNNKVKTQCTKKLVKKALTGTSLNNPTKTYVEEVKKYNKGGYRNKENEENINNSILGRYVQNKVNQNNENQEQSTIVTQNPIAESTNVVQTPLNTQKQELLNYLQNNPTAEQEYFRNLAIKNMNLPQSDQGIIQTKEEQDLIDKTFQGYNNFRYSHPWAEGLNYTPIIGDAMDVISLSGDINNKNYINVGLGLGMLALPNFIEKPIRKYNKLKKAYKQVKNWEIPMYSAEEMSNKIALQRHPDLSNPYDKNVAKIKSDAYKDVVTNKIEEIQKNVLPLYRNLSSKDQTRLINIINLSPEYGIFLQQNPTLNPLSQNTLDKFFERQSKSTRGVTANNDNIAQQYLSTPPSRSTGGDRLGTKGLYTSNSFDIADAFSRPQANSQQSSYIGKVQYPFKIDKQQSFENQLKQYRSYIDHYYQFGLNNRIPGTIAKEAVYVRGNGDHYYNITERSYYPKEENNKKIVDILELQNRGQLQNLHGRWGNSNMIPDSEYFIPKYPNNSLSDYITFMKAGTKEGLFKGVDPNEMSRNKEKIILQDLFDNQDKRRHELKYKAADEYIKLRNKVLLGGVGAASISGVMIYFMNKWNKNIPNTEEMSQEELNVYNSLLETINKKTNISIEELKKYSAEKLYSLLDENITKKTGGTIKFNPFNKFRI